MLNCELHRRAAGCSVVCFALALSGCPTSPGLPGDRVGPSVGAANRSLTELVNTLGQAKAANDEPRIVDTVGELRVLGEQTERAAQSGSDPLNRIALYRIATTAAWQAKDERVTRYANPGAELCEDHSPRAPRDCAMLTIVPVLAAAAQTTDRLNVVQRMPRATDEERARVLAEAQSVLGEFSDELTLAFQARPQIVASNADPGVVDAIDTNLERLLCETMEIKTFGVFTTVSDSRSEPLCRIGQLKAQAKAAGLTVNEVRCLDRGASVDDCD